MLIAHDMDLFKLAELIGNCCGVTRARVVRQLLTEFMWTDTDHIPPAAWETILGMAEDWLLMNRDNPDLWG